MNNKLVSLFAITASLIVCSQAHALTIVDWLFPSSGTATAPINASSWTDTTGTPTLNGTLFGSFSGTATQTYATSGANDVLQFSYTGNHPADLNSQTLTLSLTASTTLSLGSLNFSTSFNNVNKNNPLTETWTYTVTGGTGSSGTWGSITLTDTSLDGESLPNTAGVILSAGQTLLLTDTITGAQSSNGKLDFGSISILATAVPEPSDVALLLLGLILFSGAAARRKSSGTAAV